MNKKGFQFTQLPNVAFLFLIAGITFVVAILILSNFQDNTVSSVTVTNESITMTTINTTITLAHYRITSITQVLNASGDAYPSTNYTIADARAGTIYFISNQSPCFELETCYVDYIYSNYDTTVPVSLQHTITALSEIPANWFSLIIIVIVASVIIGLVMKEMGYFGRE